MFKQDEHKNTDILASLIKQLQTNDRKNSQAAETKRNITHRRTKNFNRQLIRNFSSQRTMNQMLKGKNCWPRFIPTENSYQQ